MYTGLPLMPATTPVCSGFSPKSWMITISSLGPKALCRTPTTSASIFSIWSPEKMVYAVQCMPGRTSLTGKNSGLSVAGLGVEIKRSRATAGANSLPHLYRRSGVPPPPDAVFPGGGELIHVVPVPLHPSVSAGVIALAGGLLAGAFASWRVAGLRPADALAQVA